MSKLLVIAADLPLMLEYAQVGTQDDTRLGPAAK